jgi:hypothetical protein
VIWKRGEPRHTETQAIPLPFARPVPEFSFHPAWSFTLSSVPRGLALAREKGWLLAWDEKHWLSLLNRAGELQGKYQAPSGVVAACADDGSAYVAVGGKGEVHWLTPDLMPRWQQSVPHPATAVAVDAFGQYAAVADLRGHLHIFDRYGRTVVSVECPRPLHHLAFVPAADCLVAAADYGLVAGFDLSGRLLWRDGLVAHVGALTVGGDGERIVLACFSEGFQAYSLKGKKEPRLPVPWPCRLASVSFDGRLLLAAGMTHQLALLDSAGRPLATYPVECSINALALGALGDDAYAALADGTVLALTRDGAKGDR